MKRLITDAILGLSILAISFGVARSLTANHTNEMPSGNRAFPRTSGPQIALIYVGQENCFWSNRSWIPNAIQDAGRIIGQQAAALDMSFSMIGVGLDRSPTAAIRHLTKTASFHEIHAGYSWLNMASQELFKDLPGPAATPQIIVLGRDLRVADQTPGGETFEVTTRGVLIRKVGTMEIAQWIEAGAPLPKDLLEILRQSDGHAGVIDEH